MNNNKIVAIVNCIEEDMRALAKEIGEDHISCYVIDGKFGLDSYFNKDGQKKLSFFREGENNE